MGGNLQVSQENNINDFILITILYMRHHCLYFQMDKSKHRDVKEIAQGHTVAEYRS